MSESFEESKARLWDKLEGMRRQIRSASVSHAMYQSMLKDLQQLEQDGAKILREHLQKAKNLGSHAASAEIEAGLQDWQKNINDVLGFLRKKSPSR